MVLMLAVLLRSNSVIFGLSLEEWNAEIGFNHLLHIPLMSDQASWYKKTKNMRSAFLTVGSLM